jgi:hypothetical protein
MRCVVKLPQLYNAMQRTDLGQSYCITHLTIKEYLSQLIFTAYVKKIRHSLEMVDECASRQNVGLT